MRLGEHPAVKVTYFIPDERKAGGSYTTVTGRLKKIDTWARMLVLTDGVRIPMDEILALEGVDG